MSGCTGMAHALPGQAAPAQGAGGGSQRLPASLRIAIPKAAASARRRSPRYVSPATTQASIDIRQNGVSISGYPQTVGLTPSSTGCTSTLASTYCTLALALLPGSYTATLVTMDASGTALSAAQSVPFTIVAGKANTIAVTLSGIPVTYVAELTSADAGNVTVVALDSDSNAIVGSGAPQFHVSEQSGSATFNVSQPTASSPNLLRLGAPSGLGSAVMAVTASYPSGTDACAQTGAVCSFTFTVAVTSYGQTLFVANHSYPGSISEYAPPYTGAAVTLATDSQEPSAIAFDRSGTMFVSEQNDGTVHVYAPPYATETAQIQNGLGSAGPGGIAVDGSGDVFVETTNAQTISEYTPPFTQYQSPMTATPEQTFSTSDSSGGIHNMAFDPSGALWMAGGFGYLINQYRPPSVSYTMTSGNNGVGSPSGIAFDGSGTMFVASGSSVLEYLPPYSGGPALTISSGLTAPYEVAVDTSGNLFVLNYNRNIVEFAPPYTGAPTVLTSVGASYSIALGPIAFSLAIQP